MWLLPIWALFEQFRQKREPYLYLHLVLFEIPKLPDLCR
jgi:hypothetical protein